MQFDKAKQIAEDWKKRKELNPELVCEHDNIEKEYYLGAATEDYVCVQCGEVFTRAERDNMRNR